MKRTILVILAIFLCIKCLAGGISAGPWVTETRENCLTILWTSEKPGTAYVELENGTKIWETFAGRRIFKRLHSIKIDNLQPGEILSYRLCGVELEDDSNARDPKFGETYSSPWYKVKTFNKKASSCHFSVFNDIHLRTVKYAALAKQIDSAQTDFIFLNGDIVTAGNYKLDTLVKYAIDPLGHLTAGLPILFGRGNHEGRGNNVNLIAKVFPNTDPAPFYYTFRHGPVAFIVFDAGETGKNRSVRYSGKEVYEDYLNEQIEWAKKAVKEPDFRKAPVKICLIHVPMIDHPDQNDYLTQRWLNKHIVPLLNKAGINMMIGADLHEFMMCETGSMGNNFPIIVNDDARRLEFSYENKIITIKTFNADGELEFQRQF